MFYFYDLMTILSTVITGGESAPSPVDIGETTATGGGFFGGDWVSMMLIYAAVIGAMYFLLIRPQRRREKTMREMQASLQVGNEVVTSSGFFGTIVSIGEDCFIIEFGTGKGVRIPVRKTDVIDRRSPNISVSSKD